MPFRVLPGDDASCLNLYEPRQPRIVGVGHDFIAAGRFRFRARSTVRRRAGQPLAAARTRPQRRRRRFPVIADANSMTYVLHKGLGDEIVIEQDGRPIRLRLVAALADSILQGELVMSDAHFKSLFPDQPGYRMLLVEAPAARVSDLAASSKIGSAISAPTPRRPRSGWRSFTASRTPIYRPFRRSAASDCCSGPSGSPPCCCETCSNAGASWRCSARSATAGRDLLIDRDGREPLDAGVRARRRRGCALVAISPAARARRAAADRHGPGCCSSPSS